MERRMESAMNDSSSGPHCHGSGFTPRRSPTLGISLPMPLPAGIIGTGGTAPAPLGIPPAPVRYPAVGAAPGAGVVARMLSRLSITASAKSSMNVGSVSSAGTRPHFSTPLSSANSLYSMSISSRVSMCSETNEMGTATIALVPFSPSSRMTSSVYGLSHSTGPTRD